MRGVLAFKWAKNPQDARVGTDGSVDWSGAKMAVTDDDAAAAEVARDLLGDGSIVGLTLGDGDASWAAARGAASTVCLTDASPDPDARVTADALAAGVQHIGEAEVVVIGDSPWDPLVPACLGARLGWRTVGGVTSAVVDGDHVRVTRRTSTGTQVLDVDPPVVLAVRARRAEQRTPGMRDVLAARKKPLEKLTAEALGVARQGGAVVMGTALPETTPARVIDGSDVEGAVDQLVRALRSEGVL